MGYRVRIPNAHTINYLGGTPFPFGVNSYRSKDVVCLYIYPQSLVDLCDILVDFSLVVFEVSHSTIDPQTWDALKLVEKDNYDTPVVPIGNNLFPQYCLILFGEGEWILRSRGDSIEFFFKPIYT